MPHKMGLVNKGEELIRNRNQVKAAPFFVKVATDFYSQPLHLNTNLRAKEKGRLMG